MNYINMLINITNILDLSLKQYPWRSVFRPQIMPPWYTWPIKVDKTVVLFESNKYIMPLRLTTSGKHTSSCIVKICLVLLIWILTQLLFRTIKSSVPPSLLHLLEMESINSYQNVPLQPKQKQNLFMYHPSSISVSALMTIY